MGRVYLSRSVYTALYGIPLCITATTGLKHGWGATIWTWHLAAWLPEIRPWGRVAVSDPAWYKINYDLLRLQQQQWSHSPCSSPTIHQPHIIQIIQTISGPPEYCCTHTMSNIAKWHGISHDQAPDKRQVPGVLCLCKSLSPNQRQSMAYVS